MLKLRRPRFIFRRAEKPNRDSAYHAAFFDRKDYRGGGCKNAGTSAGLKVCQMCRNRNGELDT
jgi:hypothetical protein